MSTVGERRTSQDGVVEVCTRIDPGWAETWEPLVNVYVRAHLLPIGSGYSDASIREHLREAGWIGPDEDLEEHLCLDSFKHARGPFLASALRNRQCLLRRGHGGDHRNGGYSWEPDTERSTP